MSAFLDTWAARALELWCDAAVQAAVLTALVLLLERCLGHRAPRVVAAGWWAVVLRLALPASWSSPVGVSAGIALPASEAARWPLVLLAGWALFAVGFLGLGLLRARRERACLLRGARPAGPALCRRALELARRLRLARVPEVRLTRGSGPAVLGAFRPVIVLPRALARHARAVELEHVLLHELAHVRRRDGLLGLCLLVVQALWWPHPGAWLARRRLEALRELACDRLVAGRGQGGARAYRRTLLALARPWIAHSRPLALAFVHPQSLLLRRLHALERGAREHRAAPLLALVTLLACVGPAVRESSIPPLSELEGCMRKRLAVMAALAQEAALEPR